MYSEANNTLERQTSEPEELDDIEKQYHQSKKDGLIMDDPERAWQIIDAYLKHMKKKEEAK